MKVWVAREKSECNFYIVSNHTLNRTEFRTDVSFCSQDAKIYCPRIWHRLGGPRLKPGEGPVQYDMELKWRRVK
jgi:hypothetical protein